MRTFGIMFKLLDRYVLTRFLSILMGAMVAFVTVFLVVDVVENMDKFIDAKMPRQAIVAYYLYTLPWFVSIALPMATLLATFFSIGLLNKRNEISAMKASGFSIRRIGASLLITGLLLSIGSFFFDDLLVSEGMRRKAEVQSQYLAREYRRKHKVKKQNIFLQQSPTEHIAIDRFDYRTQQARGVYIQRYEQGRLAQRMDLRYLTWDEETQLARRRLPRPDFRQRNRHRHGDCPGSGYPPGPGNQAGGPDENVGNAGGDALRRAPGLRDPAHPQRDRSNPLGSKHALQGGLLRDQFYHGPVRPATQYGPPAVQPDVRRRYECLRDLRILCGHQAGPIPGLQGRA
ncbi:hypothetical protein ES703_122120 [subsurface metagenome]